MSIPNFKINNEKIRISRVVRKISQKEIAKIIGTTQSNYSKKERGDLEFTAIEFIKLCNFYNIEQEIYLEYK